jgi:hypothetical protein
MTQFDKASPENMREPKLLRRDCIILSLLSIVTIAVCLLASEEISNCAGGSSGLQLFT